MPLAVAAVLVGLMVGYAVAFFLGMVASAGVRMLAGVTWNRRNMVIFAIALSIGLGLQLEPGALQHLPATAKVLLSSGLLPAAVIAIVLNLVLPDEVGSERGEELNGALGGEER